MVAGDGPDNARDEPGAGEVGERSSVELHDLVLHDVRTPLSTISGYAQLLRRRAERGEPDLPDLTAGLRQIEAAAKRVEYLLLELADVVPSRSQTRPLRRARVDLVALTRRVTTQHYDLANGHKRTRFLPTISELVGFWDERQLEHLILNLVHNALKYSADDRSVVVTVRREGEWAVLDVADQGVGIPPAELNRIFERGYRCTNVIGTSPGTGIGLAGAAWITAEHSGAITLESVLGKGTTVTVCLPLDLTREETQP